MQNAMLRVAAAAILLTACAAPAARAQLTIQALDLIDLSQRSATILSGEVVSVTEGSDRATGLPVRVVKLKTGDVVKAKDPGETPARLKAKRFYTFKQYNSPSLQRSDSRPPSYKVGEQVVLFLAGTSKIGFTAPMGMAQGKFTVQAVGQSRRPTLLVSNPLNNINLSSASIQSRAGGSRVQQARAKVDRLAARGGGFTAWERNVLTREDHGPLEYAPFLKLVRKLAETP